MVHRAEKMKLIMVRHGETIENKKGITQGHIPGTLSKKGKEQSMLLAKRLDDIKIDVIFTSDLRRAKDTAKIIAKFHKNAKFIEDKRLRERSFGIYNGKPRKVVFENVWQKNDLSYRPPEGESFEDVIKRLKDFYKEVLKNCAKKTILVVAHGGVLIFLTRLILGKRLEDSVRTAELQKNTAITEFEIGRKGKVKILCFNCDKHL